MAPLATEWTAAYDVLPAVRAAGLSVSYTSSNSSSGIAATQNSTDSFGGSDIPLLGVPGAYSAYSNGVLQIPWALTATAVSYHVKGVGSGLRLNAAVLAKIYTGKITTWGSSAITKLNPRYATKLKKAGRITPVFRSGGSGDSYAFETFMYKAAPSRWNFAVAGTWPVTIGVAESDNAAVQSEIQRVSGAIGYVAVPYLIHAHWRYAAAVENAAGNYILPNLSKIEAAAASATSLPPQNQYFDLAIQYPAKRYAQAYPISTFTYALLPKGAKLESAVHDFIKWVLISGQSYGSNLGFAALPKAVLAYDQKVLSSY